MRQLITRIDDDLHERLKDRAAEEGLSVNTLVVQVLRRAVSSPSPRQDLRERLRALGLLYEPPAPKRVPSRRAVIESTRGAGTAVSEALEDDRNHR